VWRNSYKSEVFKLRKRPAVWVVFGVWLALMLVFTYVFPYLGYRAAPGSATGRALLTNVLPQQLAGQAMTGYPVWGGALLVVLGALALGSEYGWGTMRTILSNRSSRMTVYTAQMGALFTSLAALVVIAFLCSALASELISVSTKGSFAGLALGSVAKSIGAGWLILCMWCTFGAALGSALRGTALSLSGSVSYGFWSSRMFFVRSRRSSDRSARSRRGCPGSTPARWLRGLVGHGEDRRRRRRRDRGGQPGAGGGRVVSRGLRSCRRVAAGPP